MLSKCFEIPKPRMGFFFTNRPNFYDAANSRFLNVFQGQGIQDCDLDVVEGSVTFRSDFGSNGRDCIRLDDTARFLFRNPIPYAGTMIAIAKVDMTGGSGTRQIWPILCGTNSNGALVPHWYFQSFSGNVTMRHGTAAGNSFANSLSLGASAGLVDKEFLFASAFDQTRKEASYIMNDGAPTQGATSAVTTNGNFGAFGDLQKAKFGDMNNDAAVSSPALPDHVDIAALLFYGGNAVRDAEAAVLALQVEADGFYGLRYGA